MIDYSCPDCAKKLVRADGGVAIEAPCKRCKRFVRLVPSEGDVLRRFYQCSECKRRQDVERPVNDLAYCMICGTPTLTVIDEVRISERPIEARAELASAETSGDLGDRDPTPYRVGS